MLVSLDQRHGGGGAAEIVMQHARRIQHALASCQASERVERALYSVIGTYAAEAGWLALDADDARRARPYADHALQAAAIARDPLLDAETWNLAVLLAHRIGDHAEALAIARTALDARFVRRDPRLRALFLARAAGGYAQRGDPLLAERHAGRAADALPRRDDGRTPPPWLSFLDEAELAGLAAADQLDVGQYTAAAASAQTTLAALRPSYTRNRLYYTLLLARARLGGRDVDGACEAAHTALDLAPTVRSTRTLTLLHTFDRALSVWRTPTAHAWRERLISESTP